MSWRTTRATASSESAARRVAVIDLGSNSWRLVLYSYAPGDWWKLTDELHETVRIGAGMGEDNCLQEEAMARGVETLSVFARFCKAAGLAGGDVHAVATSAIREAANQRAFLSRAAAAAPDFAVEVLSGEDEARLGYLAAVNSTTLREGAVLEIGGGSLQLIEVNRRRAGDLRSFELGAVRLTERFLPGTGAAGKADLRRLRKFVTKQLAALPWLADRGGRLVGIGGAVRNLAIQYESDLVHVEHVARLSLQLFDSLADQGVFAPEPGERELVWAAAMLHDVGMTISYDDHHKHSRYLILSGGLPGFDPRERALIAQMSRYHRKGDPKLGFLAPMMREGDQAVLQRGASLLRVAEHLERGRDQAVHEVRVRRNGDAAALHLRASGDITLPRWSVERYGDAELFERAFGRRLDLD